MDTLWTMAADFAVQIIMNELRPDREFITSNRGLDSGRQSSTAAVCEREKSKMEVEMCYMMVSVVRQSIVETLGVPARELALDPSATLSTLLHELMHHVPTLFKYRTGKNPKTKQLWSRLEKSNDIVYILLGSMIRKNNFIVENNRPKDSELITKSSELKTKATYNLKNLINELSKSENEMDPTIMNDNMDEMMKSDDQSQCADYTSLRIQYNSFQKEHKEALQQQECGVCEYYIHLNRMYGRPSIESWRDDVYLWPKEEPSEDSSKGSGPNDMLSRSETTMSGEDIGPFCDRSYFSTGDGLTNLDRAEKKCGAPFDFIDEGKEKKSGSSSSSSSSSGGGGGGASLLETREQTISPIDIALAINSPQGATYIGLTSSQKNFIMKMNSKRMKQKMLPKTCDGVVLKPNQLKKIRTQVTCLATELMSTVMKASTTVKQCQDTVSSLKPMLINQLQGLSRAAGSPTKIIGGQKNPKMSLIVSQIEALRVKVLNPRGFCRPDIPNPNAMQDVLLHGPRDDGANDLCVDLGYCTGGQRNAQENFLRNIINNRNMLQEKDAIKKIDTIMPPGFELPKVKEGGGVSKEGGGESKEGVGKKAALKKA